MTTSVRETTQAPSAALRFWAVLRTRIQESAEHRQLRHELAPSRLALVGVAPAETAVTREIRAMLRA